MGLSDLTNAIGTSQIYYVFSSLDSNGSKIYDDECVAVTSYVYAEVNVYCTVEDADSKTYRITDYASGLSVKISPEQTFYYH